MLESRAGVKLVSEGITDLLAAARQGDPAARRDIYERLYDELRECARRQLRGGGGTLSTTALVNESYLKLARAASLEANDRRHFVALAAAAMRQVLIDQARNRSAQKRGSPLLRVTLGEDIPEDPLSIEVLALDQALKTLEQIDARAARVVQLHFFGGLELAEIAVHEGIALSTVKRDWKAARAMLAREIDGAEPDDAGA
ncbi:MAG TPA: ECF-type sigma factor [Rhodanobacteraceae bacterium]